MISENRECMSGYGAGCHMKNTGQDFAGGLFDGTNGGSTQWAIAEGWLYSLNENGALADLIAWHSDERQDQIVERFFHPVPVEETTWGKIKSMYK